MIRFARDACAVPVPFVRCPCCLRVFPVKDNPSVCLRQPPSRCGSVTLGLNTTLVPLRYIYTMEAWFEGIVLSVTIKRSPHQLTVTVISSFSIIYNS